MRVFANGISRSESVSGAVLILGGRRSPLLGCSWLGGRPIFSDLVDVDVELQELLSYEVLDKTVIINQLLVVYFSPALQLHFLGIKLPLYFYFHKGETD